MHDRFCPARSEIDFFFSNKCDFFRSTGRSKDNHPDESRRQTGSKSLARSLPQFRERSARVHVASPVTRRSGVFQRPAANAKRPVGRRGHAERIHDLRAEIKVATKPPVPNCLAAYNHPARGIIRDACGKSSSKEDCSPCSGNQRQLPHDEPPS